MRTKDDIQKSISLILNAKLVDLQKGKTDITKTMLQNGLILQILIEVALDIRESLSSIDDRIRWVEEKED